MSACTHCGGAMEPALRYERTETVPVLCCWDCGREDPPLGRCCERTGVEAREQRAPRYCALCQQPLTDRQSRFCSRQCQYPAPNQFVERVCLCGKPFTAPLWTVKRGNGRYCSKSCAATDSNRLRTRKGAA